MSLPFFLPFNVLNLILEDQKCLSYNDVERYVTELGVVAVFLSQTKKVATEALWFSLWFLYLLSWMLSCLVLDAILKHSVLSALNNTLSQFQKGEVLHQRDSRFSSYRDFLAFGNHYHTVYSHGLSSMRYQSKHREYSKPSGVLSCESTWFCTSVIDMRLRHNSERRN